MQPTAGQAVRYTGQREIVQREAGGERRAGETERVRQASKTQSVAIIYPEV